MKKLILLAFLAMGCGDVTGSGGFSVTMSEPIPDTINRVVRYDVTLIVPEDAEARLEFRYPNAELFPGVPDFLADWTCTQLDCTPEPILAGEYETSVSVGLLFKSTYCIQTEVQGRATLLQDGAVRAVAVGEPATCT